MQESTLSAGTRARRDDAVSPVVGTLLVLAITVLGIAGVMAWGAPTIDRIQTRNAQTAVEGSFEVLQDSAQELSVPDHARFPTINVPSGTLAIAKGDRFLVAADHDAAYPSCDFHVTDWSDAGGAVTMLSPGCRGISVTCPPTPPTACLEIHAVAGSTTTKQAGVTLSGAVATVTGVDFSKGDWMFRLTDGQASPVVYAQAWLSTTDQLKWSLTSSTGRVDQFLDGGAVFSQNGGTYFLDKEAPIGDAAFGLGYYGFWMRSLVASNYVSITSPGTHSVLLSLMDVSSRVDAAAAYKIRFDVSGPLAQSWCNSLLARNSRLAGAGTYAATTGFTCATGDPLGLRSVSYVCNTCVGASHPFKFRFLHARINTSLIV